MGLGEQPRHVEALRSSQEKLGYLVTVAQVGGPQKIAHVPTATTCFARLTAGVVYRGPRPFAPHR